MNLDISIYLGRTIDYTTIKEGAQLSRMSASVDFTQILAPQAAGGVFVLALIHKPFETNARRRRFRALLFSIIIFKSR